MLELIKKSTAIEIRERNYMTGDGEKKWGDRACACIKWGGLFVRFIFYNHTNNGIDSQGA